MQAQIKRVYEFGPFQLDAGERLLLNSGHPVALTPKVFDTLLLLVENSGRLIDKEEMMRRVWQDSYVEENNLSRSIYVLRKTLGEEGNNIKYIETVPKSGYRFVANVVEVETDNFDLILEKHTSTKIVTEIEEEISDSGDLVSDPQPTSHLIPHNVKSHLHLHSMVPSRTIALSGTVVLAAIPLFIYFWTIGKSGHAATSEKVHSIAVLPFKNLGTGGDEDHLGLGVADLLITRLSNFKEINVRPTSAVLKFEDQDSITAGRLLNVDAVLEGSIYRKDNQVRVTARLVKTSDQSTLWAGQFDEKGKELFAVQDAISRQVTDSLRLNLSAGEKEQLGKSYTDNADAYQLYVKGRYFWNQRTYAGMEKALFFFQGAIEKDPNFALAHLGLADTLLTQQADEEANLALEKAIELDSNLGEAYASRGFANMFHYWNWQAAEENFKHAILLNPGYGTTHQWYATLLAITGRVEEAKQEMQRALEIDPTSPNFLADTGQMYYFAGDYDEAEKYCRRALEMSPDFIFAHQYLRDIYSLTGRNEEALEEFVNFAKSFYTGARYADTTGFHESLIAQEKQFREIYQQSGIKGVRLHVINLILKGGNGGSSYGAASNYALLNDHQQGLYWLEKAYDKKDFLLPFVKADPIFKNLHSEPRYQEIVRKLNLN